MSWMIAPSCSCQSAPPKKQPQPEEMQWRIDCAEIYFPPRITEVASHMKMKRAWALDLTTKDDNGNPSDFCIASKRKKALELLERDKLLLLVACPMFGPFGGLNDLNYTKMSEGEIRDKLRNAMMHMRFALTMCLQQLPAGRLSMFENPASASSWGTRMMHEMLGKEGVYFSTFDFC